MLFYILDWLEKAGIYDVMVVTHPDAEHKIGTYLKNAYDGKIKPSLEVCKEDDAGTADALRVVKDKIKVSFLLIEWFKLRNCCFYTSRLISLQIHT